MKTRLFIVLLFLSLFVLSLLVPPAPVVMAQGCTTVDPLENGFPWIASVNGIPDPNGYQFRQLSGEFDSVDIALWGGVSFNPYGILPFTPSSFTAVSSADVRLSVNGDPVSFEYCPPAAPTSTPTNTSVPPTPTPTEVIVTATPVPPTPTATVSTEVYLANIQASTENSFKWSIFVGTALLGVVVLLFVRVR